MTIGKTYISYHGLFWKCTLWELICGLRKGVYSGSRNDHDKKAMVDLQAAEKLIQRIIVGVPMNSQHVIVSSDQSPLSRQV